MSPLGEHLHARSYSSSPADIISYIGIPLAVLGVVPIFYVAINTLVTSYNVRRRLKKNAVAHAVTRSSILTGVVEVDLPVYTLTPPDRVDARGSGLNARPSRLKGGSWSLFNWKKLVIGRKQYRIQYSADVREPAAEIEFDTLLDFLVDKGAVPDRKGFRLLNMAGLWTPANTSLLLSPDRAHSVLRVAFPEDSDGILSLALQWRPEWADVPGGAQLGAHWVETRDHRPRTDATDKAETKPAQLISTEDVEASESAEVQDEVDGSVQAPLYEPPATAAARVHLAMRHGQPIIDECRYERVTGSYPPGAAKDGETAAFSSEPEPGHLQEAPVSTWLPVLYTAFGMMTGANIFMITVEREVMELARQTALPCGVLVLAGILRDEEVASWATEYPVNEESNARMESMMRRAAAMSFEASLTPAQREMERRKREAQERDEMMARMRNRSRREHEWRQLRDREAIESSRVATDVALAGVLRRIPEFDAAPVGAWDDLRTAAGTVLFRMLRDGEQARKTCALLERWKTWVERGGMNREDLELVLKERAEYFCWAIILMALLKTQSLEESTLANDLQECTRTWRRVKLG